MTKQPENPFDFAPSEKKVELPIFTDELVKMKGKFVEIFIGESAEQISLDQFSVPYISSIFGKIEEVYDRFILLDCLYVEKQTNELKTGNRIFINSFQVRALTLLDSRGSLQDCFQHCKDAEHIRKLFRKMHGQVK